MPAASSIIGRCPDCCACPPVRVEWDSVSAAGAKAGWQEFSGYISTPPLRYLRAVVAGEIAFKYNSFGGQNERQVWQGQLDVDPITGVITETVPLGYDYYRGTNGVCSYPTYSGFNTSSGYFLPDAATILGGCSVSATTGGRSCDIASPSPSDKYCANTLLITLSEEYTTAMLVANVQAALPAFDDDWNDTAGSYRNLSSDESTLALRRSRYRFRFPVPKVGQGCYRVSWIERFTPDGGGEPVDTPRCVRWDGDIPADYAPEDPDTDPILGDGVDPFFALAEPEANGAVDLVEIVAECTCADCP